MGVIRVTAPLFYFVNLERGYSDMKMNKWILAGTALTGAFTAHGAFAQSTASQEVDKVTEVVVTGQRNVGSTKRERGTKAKTTIGQDYLSQSSSGQTFADALNLVPGYNFTNNDAYGSSGGEIMMRGLDSARISLAVDGIQLNDSGNYAIYTNQMIESELLCSASVQTGATDVDSISASATGGTVNVSTCNPETVMGGVVKVAVGQENHKSGFLRFDTGKFGPWGTTAYVAYTGAYTDTWTVETPDNLRLQKNQYNAMIHQNVGDNGSFISMALHWNENRNHFIGTQSKTQIATRGYGVSTSNLASVNPSDTGNIRIKSKWVLSDKLTLTVDPSFQYVLALGGSTGSLSESSPQLIGSRVGDTTVLKLSGTTRYFDTNGNNTLDTLSIYRPNITNTHRYGLQSGLIYRFTDTQLVRFNASFDRANHRQTGEATLLDANGAPIDLFAGKENTSLRIKTADGFHFRRRDRFSKANVDVFSIEYSGRFFDEKLFVSLGLRNQKLERELNQFCYTQVNTNGSINPYCSTQNWTSQKTTADGKYKVVTLQQQGTPSTIQYIAPYSNSISFEKTMPNIGLTWNFENGGQVFATYAESLSSPRTDALYDVDYDAASNSVKIRNPNPETSETVEVGYRYTTANFNATATAFSSLDKDRLVEAFVQDDPNDVGYSAFTNIGKVKRNGYELSSNYRPVPNLILNAGLTYTDTELQQDIPNGFRNGVQRLLPTKGKALTGMPKWMWTAGVDFDPTDKLSINLNAKYVGDRFYTYVNDEVAPRYILWNASARYDLPFFKDGTYVQLNVVNLFDEQYLAGTGYQNTARGLTDNAGGTVSASTIFYQQGAPRTVSIALRTKF
ncbi:TonB-dependent receptor [Asticcacaulis excentricus CB 48]|uniref:TonB-dependent receptor n=2 Tax=Asticcacaulis excentricus TaxID=78587 RepID=E8RL67_ASTEC|nr:TonB-dependent receptor [Asticcacaulis excentricus CB 48]